MFKYSLFLLVLISNYALSEVTLPDIAPHYTHFKGLHDVMMHSVENDTTLTTAQKMAEHTKQLNQLKTDFRAKRKSEYESVNVEFERDFDLADIKSILQSSPGVIVEDDTANQQYPMPMNAHEKDEVFVGRLRRDESQPNTLNMWVVSDNLRKGAATNAVQIAQYLVDHKLL